MSVDHSGLFFGVDIAKGRWDVASQGDKKARVFKDMEELLIFLEGKTPNLVVVEASGGLEGALVERCWDLSIPVAVINPQHSKNFRLALGNRAKTDSIDACALARYGAAIKPMPRIPIPEDRREARRLVNRRQQLIKSINQEGNRLRLATGEQTELIENTLLFLRGQAEFVERRLDEMVVSMGLQKTMKLLQTVPSVGEMTARRLVVDLPELGLLNRRQIAAIVGLCPWSNQSGGEKKAGGEHIGGGRTYLRSSLWMCTMRLIEDGGVLHDWYFTLKSRGKPVAVAKTAVLRRMLTWCNAVVRDGEPFDLNKALSGLNKQSG